MSRRQAALPGTSAPGVGGGYGSLSLWFDTVASAGEDDLTPRPGLDGDLPATGGAADVPDVCVVGAGLTGLWTAYHLLREDPSLRVVVVEAEIAGFGASGRNGGWCSALFPVSTAALARRHGREQALAMRRALQVTVAEIGATLAAEGIACDWRHGGTVELARTPVQLARARAQVAQDEAFDRVDGLRLLSAREAAERVRADGVLGATFAPHCARVHPARLVRGLARAVERLGGTILEGTRVLRIVPGSPGSAIAGPRVVTARGTVRARYAVRATEAWTATLPGSTRDVAPVYSLMIATPPLGPDVWDGIGLAGGETFADQRHLIVYGQRTADDRLAFGGRGAPYHLGSRIEPAFDHEPRVFAALRRTVADLFPALADVPVSHRWGGPLGVPRDWHASVGLDRDTGIAWAGGYVGDGVALSGLAGRTLADLLLRRDTSRTRLPWVGHRSPRWEPEPWRWLGVNAGLRVMSAADLEERLTGRESLAARAASPLLGH